MQTIKTYTPGGLLLRHVVLNNPALSAVLQEADGNEADTERTESSAPFPDDRRPTLAPATCTSLPTPLPKSSSTMKPAHRSIKSSARFDSQTGAERTVTWDIATQVYTFDKTAEPWDRVPITVAKMPGESCPKSEGTANMQKSLTTKSKSALQTPLTLSQRYIGGVSHAQAIFRGIILSEELDADADTQCVNPFTKMVEPRRKESRNHYSKPDRGDTVAQR